MSEISHLKYRHMQQHDISAMRPQPSKNNPSGHFRGPTEGTTIFFTVDVVGGSYGGETAVGTTDDFDPSKK